MNDTIQEALFKVSNHKKKYDNLFELFTAEPQLFEGFYNGTLTEGVMKTGDALHLLAKTIDDQFQREVEATMITPMLIKRQINLTTGSTEVIPKREGVIARTVAEAEAFPLDYSQYKKMEVTVYKSGLATAITREMIKDSRFDVMAMNLEDTYRAVAHKVDYEMMRCIQSSVPGGCSNVVTPGTYTAGQNASSTYHPDTDYQGLNQSSYNDNHVVDAGGSFSLEAWRTAMKYIERHEYVPKLAICHPYQAEEIRALDTFKGITESTYVSTPDILNQMISQGFIGSLYGVRIIRSTSVMPGVITMLDPDRAAVQVVREPIQIEREYILKQQIEHAQVFTRQAPAVVDGNALAQIYNLSTS